MRGRIMAKKVIMKRKPRSLSMAQVAKVASTVEIANVSFVSFSARQSLHLFEGNMVVEYAAKTKTRLDKKQSRIHVLVAFEMHAFPEEAKPSDKQVEIEATLKLVYDSPDAGKFSQEALDWFGRANGVYNGWPYWREFVQNATTRMGLPPLVIPTFRLPKASKRSRPRRKAVTKQK